MLDSNSFIANNDELISNLNCYIDVFIKSLSSDFLVLPKGNNFIEFQEFDFAYEKFKKYTKGFKESFNLNSLSTFIINNPKSFIILRTILGLTVPEWAHLTKEFTNVEINQGYARNLEKSIRESDDKPLNITPTRLQRLEAMLKTAIDLLQKDYSKNIPGTISRMDKIDTKYGFNSIEAVARLHVPYSMLLYERYLGRPFASHRDSVSELVGDVMENAIEALLTNNGVTFHRTGRAERIPGFDQAPDFIIPSIANPQIIIEAKITEDDGTARDKVTRIQHLREMANKLDRPYEVVACVDGRGFGIRRDDVRKMLEATNGKLFTRKTIDFLIEFTQISQYITI